MSNESFRNKPVLVTGGAGFIGSHLVDALVERGAHVRVLDNLATGRLANLAHHGADVDWIEGDIRDSSTCREAADGVALIFHQAALGSVPRSLEDPVTTLEVNLMGTIRVLAAASECGVRRVIFASSSSVFGDSEKLPKREGEEGEPLSPYAGSKAAAELAAIAFGQAKGLETIGLRYFNVYGPRQDPSGPYAAVVPRFVEACLSGEPPVIYGDGTQSRDFTYVGDAVRANLLAATAPHEALGKSFNVGGGTRTTIRDLARLTGRVAGVTMSPIHQDPRPGDVQHSLADLSNARRHLAYRPATDLRTGLERTVSFHRDIPSQTEVS